MMTTRFQWEVDPETIPQSEAETQSRTVTIQRDFSEGKSVKFRNFKLDLSGFAKLAADFALLGQDALDKPKPMVVAAGVLLTLWTLRGEMTEKLSEQEASVFWGMAMACAHKSPRWATKTRIAEATNAERAKVGLKTLDEGQVQHSLIRLIEISAIARVRGQDNTYEMIEDVET